MLRSVQLSEAIADSSRRLGIRRRYDLGVLLVHGLGEQARGDTLTVQGDPIISWLRGRVGSTGKPGEAKVDVLDAVARQTSSDTIPNPHAIIRITPPANPASPSTTVEPTYWVVAEAYWAENFRQATFLEFVGWVVTIGPWVFATQVAGIARRIEIGKDVPNPLRVFLIPITFVVGGALALIAAAAGFLVTVLAAAVTVVAFTRIPFVADAARSFQRTLANGFGDAYVLTRSPVRFAAMSAEVRAGLQVLRRACSAVVLVAESQGTAVAWYGLKHEIVDPLPAFDDDEADGRPQGQRKKETEPAPIGLFLTHGQALRKLTFALAMARGEQTMQQTLAAIGSGALFGLAVAAYLVGAPWTVSAVAVALALVAEVLLLISAMEVWDASGKEIESDWKAVLDAEAKAAAEAQAEGEASADLPKLEWLDLWASADPASVGPLGVRGERITSYKIRNVGSIWADHVAYWSNTTEFLPMLASYLFGLGGPRAYSVSLADPRLLVPAMRRHARVVLLIPFRGFIALGVLAGLIYAWLTPDFGRGLIAFAGSLNLQFVDAFFDAPPEWAMPVAGYLAVVLSGVILWLPVNLFWNALMQRDETTFFQNASRPLWTLPWYALGALLLPVAAVVVALLLLANQPTLAIGYLLAGTWVALLGLAVLSGGGQTYGSEELLQPTIAATTKITGHKTSGLAIAGTLAAAIVGVPLLAALFVPGVLLWVLAGETLLLSAVLAAEGIREYRVFKKRFDQLNRRLSGSAKGSEAVARASDG